MRQPGVDRLRRPVSGVRTRRNRHGAPPFLVPTSDVPGRRSLRTGGLCAVRRVRCQGPVRGRTRESDGRRGGGGAAVTVGRRGSLC
ncbi:MAG: hypothetical protein MZV63_56455 [Marinilabiliales bacterium]|nr:hypothetical protein [Marinilabiliales bacterium]